MTHYLKLILVISFLVSFPVRAEDEVLKKCKEAIHSGHWTNRYLGNLCLMNYDLPSPFTMKCLRRELQNYHGLDEMNVRECHFHFRDNKRVFKDHYDYDYQKELPKELLLPFQIIKRSYTTQLD